MDFCAKKKKQQRSSKHIFSHKPQAHIELFLKFARGGGHGAVEINENNVVGASKWAGVKNSSLPTDVGHFIVEDVYPKTVFQRQRRARVTGAKRGAYHCLFSKNSDGYFSA